MKPAGKSVMMIKVAIVPDESMAPLDAVTEKKATMAVNSTLMPTYLWEAERGTMWRCFVNSIR